MIFTSLSLMIMAAIFKDNKELAYNYFEESPPVIDNQRLHKTH